MLKLLQLIMLYTIMPFFFQQSISNSKQGFAVVELFTSEGCSSCPSADLTIGKLRDEHRDHVFILCYHVDYWDRLGWKDAFSDAAYSTRQRTYAAALHLNTIYTPQVIINGATEFVGSDKGRLKTALSENLSAASAGAATPTLSVTANSESATANYSTGGNSRMLLNLAFVQPNAVTNVKRGENNGRILHHVNVVRELKTSDVHGTSTISFAIPGSLKHQPLEVIAFLQDAKSMKVLAASQVKF